MKKKINKIKNIIYNSEQKAFFIYFENPKIYSRIEQTEQVRTTIDAEWEFNNFFKKIN